MRPQAPTPRLEVDLEKIRHNAAALVQSLASRNIAVIGVTKATLGCPAVARALVEGGVAGLGDSRMQNLRRLAAGGVDADTTLIRSPMPSQVDLVVAGADTSVNTEIDVLRMLSSAARRAGRTHRVVLMVELGDLREGVMPEDLDEMVRVVIGLPNLLLEGIGTNLACQNGVIPSRLNMDQLSTLVDEVETTTGVGLSRVSGGNSANLPWALGSSDIGRVNELRLGESILLGRQPLDRRPIEGLHTDAFRLIAEVIESKVKPSHPTGAVGRTAFGARHVISGEGNARRLVVAIGRQDVDHEGLVPIGDAAIIGASSDHMILTSPSDDVLVGSEVSFEPDYSALLRAMTSPFVDVVIKPGPRLRCRDRLRSNG